MNIEALRAGMVRFRFLLHGCQPGSVPDPKIVASMLDLVSWLNVLGVKFCQLGGSSDLATVKITCVASVRVLCFVRFLTVGILGQDHFAFSS